MEKKAILKNETEINNTNLKTMMLYLKFRKYKNIIFLKLGVCIFIIISTIILDLHIIDKVFFIFISILGIEDTLIISGFRISNAKILHYDFFEDSFSVSDQQTIFEIKYEEVENIINTRKYYYLIITSTAFIISKNGFIIGTTEELENLIETKVLSELE